MKKNIKSNLASSFKQNTPLVSVIMPTYNREKFLPFAIDSILNQTFKNFEFIIIDDASRDNTPDIIKYYRNLDLRIIYIRNEEHMNYAYGLRKGVEISRGKYIARMDDDDISDLTRFQKQFEYMENNPDIVVLGSLIDYIGSLGNPWCPFYDPDVLDVMMNFRNYICHPSVFIRKSFLMKNCINYFDGDIFAEDYKLWADIMLAGGRIANYPEVLLHYRIHSNRITDETESQEIQRRTVRSVSNSLLQRFETLHMNFDLYKNRDLISAVKNLQKLNNQKNVLSDSAFEKTLDFLQRRVYPAFDSNNIPVVFPSGKNFVPYLAVAIKSLIESSSNINNYDILILEENLSDNQKRRLKELVSNKQNFSLRFINLEYLLIHFKTAFYIRSQFSVETYYRYFLPVVCRHYEKVIYLNSDIVIKEDIANLYSIDIGNNLLGVTPDLEIIKYLYAEEIGIMDRIYQNYLSQYLTKTLAIFDYKKYFQAGIMVCNIKEMLKTNFTEMCFYFNKQISSPIFVVQDILNRVCYGKVFFIDQKWNMTWHVFINNVQYVQCIPVREYNSYLNARKNPAIIHFTSKTKPWNYPWEEFADEFWKYAKKTSFYEEILLKNSKFFAKKVESKIINFPGGFWKFIHYLSMYRLYRSKYYFYNFISLLFPNNLEYKNRASIIKKNIDRVKEFHKENYD